ncbi:MAG TPA: hypothetical protein VGK67_24055 [Myxococcales bacterium]
MKRLCRWLAALTLAAAMGACASAPPRADSKPAASVSHFVGTMSVSSPDGKIPYGPPKKAVVSRTLSPSTGTIVEDVAQDGMVNTTTLTRRADTSTFDATDAGHTFSGTVAFKSDPFAMTEWEYAIVMADGSRISGHGSWSTEGIRTQKLFSAPDGTPKVQIADALRPATESEASSARASLEPPKRQ